MVELRQLRYFTAVAELGQISAAARNLRIAQPALTRAICGLECTLGVELFIRHPRGVTLTPAGRRLLEGARTALAACDRAVTDARELAPARRTITVGAIPATPALGAILQAFRVAYPDFTVRWVPLDFVRDSVAVSAGQVDVAFVVPAYRDAGVRVERLIDLPVFACITVDHPLAARRVVRAEELVLETFPGQCRGHPDRFADTFYLTEVNGRRPAAVAGAPNTPDETWALVASGEVVTTTPAGAWASCPERIAVRHVIDAPPFSVRLMWREDGDPAVQTFVAYMRARFGLDAKPAGEAVDVELAQLAALDGDAPVVSGRHGAS